MQLKFKLSSKKNNLAELIFLPETGPFRLVSFFFFFSRILILCPYDHVPKWKKSCQRMGYFTLKDIRESHPPLIIYLLQMSGKLYVLDLHLYQTYSKLQVPIRLTIIGFQIDVNTTKGRFQCSND